MKPISLYFLITILLFNSELIAQNTDTIKNVFGEKEETLYNFAGNIYYLPYNTNKLPDFNKLEPQGKIYANSLNINKQNFKNGFPGVSDRFEYFAIDYKGQFYIKDKCNYCFMLGSDDGSKLFIDDKLVIDNDYSHELRYKSNCIILNPGIHKIEVQYFQGPRYEIALMLLYKKEGEKAYQKFNISKFYPITVTEKENVINVSIGNEILFEYNSFNLSAEAKHALTEIKRIIIDKIKIKSIVIEGHTDDTGSERNNMQLSEKRANAVKLYFTKIGVSNNLIITKGFGETKPKIPNVDDDSRKQNRRIELTFNKMNN